MNDWKAELRSRMIVKVEMGRDCHHPATARVVAATRRQSELTLPALIRWTRNNGDRFSGEWRESQRAGDKL